MSGIGGEMEGCDQNILGTCMIFSRISNSIKLKASITKFEMQVYTVFYKNQFFCEFSYCSVQLSNNGNFFQLQTIMLSEASLVSV